MYLIKCEQPSPSSLKKTWSQFHLLHSQVAKLGFSLRMIASVLRAFSLGGFGGFFFHSQWPSGWVITMFLLGCIACSNRPIFFSKDLNDRSLDDTPCWKKNRNSCAQTKHTGFLKQNLTCNWVANANKGILTWSMDSNYMVVYWLDMDIDLSDNTKHLYLCFLLRPILKRLPGINCIGSFFIH